MDKQSGTYYWPTTFPEAPSYKPLNADIQCDVLIIGGGSSAAQCAYYLAQTNLHVVVIEKSTVGSGSTATNTALLQYSGEKMFINLVNTFGKAYIEKHLALLKDSIDEIERASQTVPIDCEFTRRDTLYSASLPEDIERLKKEYDFLVKNNCDVSFWTKEDIEAHYPFSRDAAIYSSNDAEINPFKFTHALLDYAFKNGVRIYEQTEMNGHYYDEKIKKTIISTKNKHTIEARYVIFAAGYEGIDVKKEKQVSFVSTYTVTTNTIDDFSSWYNRTLLWETARPYLYLRTTMDNRIIIGGLDENTTSPQDRDSKLIHKKNKLIEEFNAMFPTIQVKPEYFLASFYGGTADGLPIIGVYEQYPQSYFLFAFGDNGTVYSQLLARLIVQEISEGYSPDIQYYLQDRPLLSKMKDT
ncbi:NAD(P)/FAD-dependent oxidoreductase [Lysinibacillus sp. 54212]|uniref:NAD(P)/FAD-dependent oxidoreductase n=1 Tax=Lysinibacillus sp. 54212 TaxID=3119829 RepID=UPI002FC91364